MSTISQNLQRLQTAKTDIATAITNMGGTVNSGDGFEDFASDIENIPTSQESGFSVTVNVTSSILNLYLSVYLCVNTTIDIDWGDGTTHSIVSYDVNTEQPFIPHTYSTTGIYTINVTFIGFGLCAISGSYNYGCALITSGYYTPTYSSSICCIGR